MIERIQVRLKNEFQDYKEQVLTQSGQGIFNRAYETAIKQEIALFFIEWVTNNEVLETLDKFPKKDVLLEYLYDVWLNADVGIDKEVFDILEIELGI